jgi:hypothetical protein
VTAASGPEKHSAIRSVVEWFWRSGAIEQWQRSTELSGDLSANFAGRSRLSADLANVSVTTAEPFGGAVGCDLYRQAVYWALCALAPKSEPSSSYSERVWAHLDDELLRPLAATVDERSALRVRLVAGDFVAFAGLSASEQATCCAAFRDLNATLLARYAERHLGLSAIRQQRAFRIGGLLACLVTLFACAAIVRARVSRGADLALEAEWRTSSSYSGGGGCSSPDQECEGKNGWFFHTAEGDNEPWIEFDLGGSKSVATVAVENRDDCCLERAVPLVIEVSDDQQHWRPVATRKEQFATWRATFPALRARWLRLHLLHPGPLHLKRVQIFRDAGRGVPA